MTPEQQRIAIAEACGWQGPHHPENVAGMENWWSQNRGIWWVCPDGSRVLIGGVPDYLNDLNAMHEAENAVIRPKRLWYQYCLKLPGRSFDESIGATAAQRAEAFLRTLNIWKP